MTSADQGRGQSDEAQRPRVSVLVITKDDRHFIRDCLDSLLTQDIPVDELIVLDCGSTDGTPELVSRFTGITKLVRNVPLADAVDVGRDLARGEVVVVTDARARCTPTSLRFGVWRLRQTRDGVATVDATPVGATSFGRAVTAVASLLPVVAPGLLCWATSGALPSRSEGRPSHVRTWRFMPDTPAALARKSYNAGVDGARPLRSADPTVALPAILIVSSVVAAVSMRGWQRAVVPIAHGILCAGTSVRRGHYPDVAPHRVFLALEVGHWSTGAGALRQLLTGKAGPTAP